MLFLSYQKTMLKPLVRTVIIGVKSLSKLRELVFELSSYTASARAIYLNFESPEFP